MNFIALLLFEQRVAGQQVAYSEEIHLLDATSRAEAAQRADARARAQEVSYDNAAGEVVTYRFLHIVDLQPWLYPSAEEAIYTRSFVNLHAYREVASLD